jgi:hypothetical protein
MKNKVIEFVHLKHKQVSFRVEDEWKFVPAGRFQWLQRAAWKTLHRLGSLQNATGWRETVTKHVIDPDNFMEKLYKQRSAIFDMLGKEGQTLLIGAEDFSEMMSSPEIGHQFEFRSEYTSDRKLMGLNVKIIPWMRGLLVMP